MIDVRDNGTPLLFRSLNRDENTDQLLTQAENTARDLYDLDISDFSAVGILSRHVEFSINGADGTDYYVSAALIPKAKGHLSVLLLYSLRAEQTAIRQQRTLFYPCGYYSGFDPGYILPVFYEAYDQSY